MKTTLYGNGRDRNEFGVPKVPKETNFVHAKYTVKTPLSIPAMREMCEAFHQKHGCYPDMLYVASNSIATKYVSFQIRDTIVGLSVVYDAPETRVA